MTSAKRGRPTSPEARVARLIHEAPSQLKNDDWPAIEVPSESLVKPSAVVSMARHLVKRFNILEDAVGEQRQAKTMELAAWAPLFYCRDRLAYACWALWQVADATQGPPLNDLLDFCIEQNNNYVAALEMHRSTGGLAPERLAFKSVLAQQKLSGVVPLLIGRPHLLPSRFGPENMHMRDWVDPSPPEREVTFPTTIWFETNFEIIEVGRPVQSGLLKALKVYCEGTSKDEDESVNNDLMQVGLDGAVLHAPVGGGNVTADLMLRVQHLRPPEVETMSGRVIFGLDGRVPQFTRADSLLVHADVDSLLGATLANMQRLAERGVWDPHCGAVEGIRLSEMSARRLDIAMVGSPGLTHLPGAPV